MCSVAVARRRRGGGGHEEPGRLHAVSHMLRTLLRRSVSAVFPLFLFRLFAAVFRWAHLLQLAYDDPAFLCCFLSLSPSLPLSLSPSLPLSLSLPSLQQGFKQECPACRAPSELKDITKNAALQVVAAAFSAGRPAWLAALVGGVNGAVAPYPPAVKRTSSLSSPGPVPQHRLAVLCYTMMKEPQLRRLLSDHGLPTHGIKAALVGRHSAFVTLHNAELDSIEPRYGAGLLAVCRSGCLRVFVRSPDFLVSAAPFRTW